MQALPVPDGHVTRHLRPHESCDNVTIRRLPGKGYLLTASVKKTPLGNLVPERSFRDVPLKNIGEIRLYSNGGKVATLSGASIQVDARIESVNTMTEGQTTNIGLVIA